MAATGEVGDTLRLDRPTNQLKELVVNAKPVMQRTAGQFTYLPNDLRSKTDNSFELLRLVPLLDVSDRGISIFGKGLPNFHQWTRPHDRTRCNHGDAARDASFAYSPNRDNNSPRKQIQRRRPPRNSKRGALESIRRSPGSTTATVRYTTGRVAPAYSLWLGASKGKFNASASFSYYSSNTLFKTLGNYNYTDLNRHVTNFQEPPATPTIFQER